MQETDLADATARALGLLDAEDLANSDPRLFRDPQLAGEVRLVREAAAEVWLAVSPLRVAPAEVFHELMGKIEPAPPVRQRGPVGMMAYLAASGWAAALAIFLWPTAATLQVQKIENARSTAVMAADTVGEIPASSRSVGRVLENRRSLVQLRERLASVKRDRAGASPRVIHLTAPSTLRRSAEESRIRVQSILMGALRSALEADRAVAADPTELVIERGWLPGGPPLPADGRVIRHRNFPEQAWYELGLLRSEDGEYLDVAAQVMWAAAVDGRGFTGRKITADEDVSRFSRDETPAVTQVAKPRTVAEGFIIESEDEDKVEVVIDQVAPPAMGSQHWVILTDPAGRTHTLPVPPQIPVPRSLGEEPLMESGFSVVPWAAPEMSLIPMSVGDPSVIVFTLAGRGLLDSFKLVERRVGGDGRGDTIIVEGGP